MPKTKTAPAPASKQRYFILDERATDLVIDGKHVKVTDKMREDGVEMTESEAMLYVAGGTIGSENPSKSKAAQQAVAANAGEVPDFSKKEHARKDK